MKERILEKIKSPVVWVSAVAIVANVLAVYTPFAEDFKLITTAVINIALLFGVLNNPDDKTHF